MAAIPLFMLGLYYEITAAKVRKMVQGALRRSWDGASTPKRPPFNKSMSIPPTLP